MSIWGGRLSFWVPLLRRPSVGLVDPPAGATNDACGRTGESGPRGGRSSLGLGWLGRETGDNSSVGRPATNGRRSQRPPAHDDGCRFGVKPILERVAACADTGRISVRRGGAAMFKEHSGDARLARVAVPPRGR